MIFSIVVVIVFLIYIYNANEKISKLNKENKILKQKLTK